MAQIMLANFLVTELSSGQPVSPLPGEIKSTALWRPVLAIPSLSTFLVVGILLISWGGGIPPGLQISVQLTRLIQAGTRTVKASPRAPFPPS